MDRDTSLAKRTWFLLRLLSLHHQPSGHLYLPGLLWYRFRNARYKVLHGRKGRDSQFSRFSLFPLHLCIFVQQKQGPHMGQNVALFNQKLFLLVNKGPTERLQVAVVVSHLFD